MVEGINLAGVNLAGKFSLPGSAHSVNRMGYGAMQLAGRDGSRMMWGPPRDVEGAIRVLREAVASGVNHIDTSDFYGPHVTNQIIRKAQTRANLGWSPTGPDLLTDLRNMRYTQD